MREKMKREKGEKDFQAETHAHAQQLSSKCRLRSWWLSNISSDDAGRPRSPPVAEDENEDWTCFILESWTSPAPGNSTRSINVYTNAPSAELLLNGERAEGGDVVAVPYFGMATFGASRAQSCLAT